MLVWPKLRKERLWLKVMGIVWQRVAVYFVVVIPVLALGLVLLWLIDKL